MNVMTLWGEEEVASRVCTKCGESKTLDNFSAHSGANYLRRECKKCNNELSKVRSALKEKYGMPSSDYRCPICLGDANKVNGKGNTRNGPWVIDHCHETDTFRGWLCHSCNRGIGNFADDIDMLRNAIKYLESCR